MSSPPLTERTTEGREAPRILLVSHSVLPTLSGSATIVGNLASAFALDELVLACDESEELARDHRANPRPVHYLTHEFRWPRRGRRWLRWLVLPWVTACVCRLAARQRCEVVIGVFPFAPYFIAAFLAARLTRRTFIPYLHNTYSHNRRGLARLFAVWWERRILTSAPLVLVISDGLREFYEQQYRGVHFETLPHSFSGEEAVPSAVTPATPRNLLQALSLAVLGNINASNVDAFQRLLDVVSNSPDFHLTVYSPTSRALFARLQGMNAANITLTSTPPDQTVAMLSQHDLLVLPHGFCGTLEPVEYETIFPTRLLDYLRAARPVLAHAPANCFVTRWLVEHGCAEVADIPDAAALRGALLDLAAKPDRQRELVDNGLTAVQQFRAVRVGRILRGLLTTGAAENCEVRHEQRESAPT